MDTTSLNGFSPTYIKTMLADQLTAGTLANSSNKNSKTSQPSSFSKMLSDSATDNTSTNTSATNQMLNQLIYNFQTNGLKSQGNSLDPSSFGE